jgi:hypothetical protein
VILPVNLVVVKSAHDEVGFAYANTDPYTMDVLVDVSDIITFVVLPEKYPMTVPLKLTKLLRI